MGNPQRGEVEFKVGNKSYTLYFSINAMCELEDALGDGIVQLASGLSDSSKLKIKDIRTTFWAGLRDHHEAVDVLEAGRIMTELGLTTVSELIAKAFTLAFPEADASRPLPAAAPGASTGKAH